MLPPDITIVQQAEDYMFQDGTTVPVIRVRFMVGKHGPFRETFPKDTFTADVRDAKIAAFAQQVRTS